MTPLESELGAAPRPDAERQSPGGPYLAPGFVPSRGAAVAARLGELSCSGRPSKPESLGLPSSSEPVRSAFSPWRRCVWPRGPPSPPPPARVPGTASRMQPSGNHYSDWTLQADSWQRPERAGREPGPGRSASAAGQFLGASHPHLLLPLWSPDQHCKMTRRVWPRGSPLLAEKTLKAQPAAGLIILGCQRPPRKHTR